MKRKKLYIILSIITILCLFITAATCSFCGKQPGTASSDETKVDVDKSKNDNISENTDKESVQDTNAIQADNEDSDNTFPTISLAISEGPTYSAADDVCWYRVKATITGIPSPKITWSTDYSNGSFGNIIAQVNLTRDNPEYSLTATATNSEGIATDDIDLSWGCDGEDGAELTEEEAETEELEVTLVADESLSGIIVDGEEIGHHACVVGDNNNDTQGKGYLSFNISELGGINVFNAQLNLNNATIFGNPEMISPYLNIKAYDYGDSLDYGDFAVGGISISTIDISEVEPGDSLQVDGNDVFINTLQDAIDDGKTWYQLKLGLLKASYDNDTSDVLAFYPISNLTLTINYTE